MRKFSDFGIETNTQSFIGEKIKVERVLNQPIIVHKYKIENSKINSGKCLHLQIEYKGEKRVIFTGSTVLLDTILKLPADAFPFETTIVKSLDHYQFT